MRSEIFRDRTVDWTERLLASPWIDRTCKAVIAIAYLYFGLGLLAAVVR
jgi:hypothetical protein